MFPPLYHAQHSRHSEDLPFWLELAARQHGPILELGCGTGRVLSALSQAGFQVFGLDNDMEMLTFLRDKVPASSSQARRVFLADMSQFHLAALFRLILLPCNTYSTLPSHQRRAMLGCLRRHLSPGGLFATSLPNPHLLHEFPAYGERELEDIFLHPDNQEPVQVSSAWQRTRQHFIIHWHYDRLQSDGKVQRLSVQVTHNLTLPAEYLKELETAGFTTIDIFGNFDHSDYRVDSPYLIVMAS